MAKQTIYKLYKNGVCVAIFIAGSSTPIIGNPAYRLLLDEENNVGNKAHGLRMNLCRAIVSFRGAVLKALRICQRNLLDLEENGLPLEVMQEIAFEILCGAIFTGGQV